MVRFYVVRTGLSTLFIGPGSSGVSTGPPKVRLKKTIEEALSRWRLEEGRGHLARSYGATSGRLRVSREELREEGD